MAGSHARTVAIDETDFSGMSPFILLETGVGIKSGNSCLGRAQGLVPARKPQEIPHSTEVVAGQIPGNYDIMSDFRLSDESGGMRAGQRNLHRATHR
jgi:hypothetical protein